MDKGHQIHQANIAAIQQYEGLKYTDDHSDARWLAHILRLGVLPEGYIYPKEERSEINCFHVLEDLLVADDLRHRALRRHSAFAT